MPPPPTIWRRWPARAWGRRSTTHRSATERSWSKWRGSRRCALGVAGARAGSALCTCGCVWVGGWGGWCVRVGGVGGGRAQLLLLVVGPLAGAPGAAAVRGAERRQAALGVGVGVYGWGASHWALPDLPFAHPQPHPQDEVVAYVRRRSSAFSRGKSRYRGVSGHAGRWEARIGSFCGRKNVSSPPTPHPPPPTHPHTSRSPYHPVHCWIAWIAHPPVHPPARRAGCCSAPYCCGAPPTTSRAAGGRPFWGPRALSKGAPAGPSAGKEHPQRPAHAPRTRPLTCSPTRPALPAPLCHITFTLWTLKGATWPPQLTSR
jgi:hypothetical protein